MAKESKSTKKTNTSYKNIRASILKTELGKKTYKKLTVSTIILMISLLGIAIMMTCFCNYFMNGGDWNDLHLAFSLFPIFSTMAFISGTTTCFFTGEYSMLIKTHRK